jgi:hypothetical protein
MTATSAQHVWALVAADKADPERLTHNVCSSNDEVNMKQCKESSSRLAFGMGLLGLAAGATAILLVTRHAPTGVRELRAEIDGMKAALERKLPVVREIRTVQVLTAPPADTVPPLPVTDEPSVERAREPILDEDERQHRIDVASRARVKLVADTYEEEDVDREWASQAEQTIQNTYSSEEFSGLLMSTDCRATLCKTEFEYADPATGMLAVRQFVSTHPWPGARLTHVNQEAQRGSSYFVRENLDLPNVDATSLND